jgi:hypothetical protein
MGWTPSAAGFVVLAACGTSSVPSTSKPASDAADIAAVPVADAADAETRDAHAEARSDASGDAKSPGHSDGAPTDARAETGVDAAGPLTSCEQVTAPPAPGCPASLGADFMCAVTEAAELRSLGCTATDVVGSGEVLGCCPPCAGTDGGACYQ